MRFVTAAAAVSLILFAIPVVVAQYNPVNALRGVYYTKVSTCPPAAIQSWTCGASCTNFTAGSVTDVTVIWQDSDQTQMFIAYNSQFNEIVVAFRGSTTLLNWLEDAEVWQDDYPYCAGCKAHAGFLSTYNQIAPNISAAVQSLLSKYPNATLFVVGHSLGAAQARLCALDMHRQFGTTTSIVTSAIGAPRFANEALSQWAEQQLQSHEHYYITHDADPVPHLPPKPWGYIHFPQEVWYKKDISPVGYVVCNGTATYEDPHCADSLPFPINIEDHLWYLGVNTGCDPTGSGKVSDSQRLQLRRMLQRHGSLLKKHHVAPRRKIPTMDKNF